MRFLQHRIDISKMTIKYIGLDFDQCICEINHGFRLVHLLYRDACVSGSFKTNTLAQTWKQALAKAYLDGRLTFLNPEMMDFLRYLHSLPEDQRPTIFVYTNNKDQDLVAFIHSIIEAIVGYSPWLLSFHPQDICRQVETPFLAPDEPGKSYDGINNCLGRPDDLTKESLLFFDDLLHPLHKEIGDHYIQITPPYHCFDALVDYLQLLVQAFHEANSDPADEIRFRSYVRTGLAQYTRKYISLFPAPYSAYEEWDMVDWNYYYDLYKFGGSTAPATQEKSNLVERALQFFQHNVPVGEKIEITNSLNTDIRPSQS